MTMNKEKAPHITPMKCDACVKWYHTAVLLK